MLKTKKNLKPIFLHSSWRTSSTYLWNKYRSHSYITAYYEPFHEILNTISHSEVELLTHKSWESKHPELVRPYFSEYLPLIQIRGVEGFKNDFSYSNFFVNNEELIEQKFYIERLLDSAIASQQKPVLGFCRSTGRTRWMREMFPNAVHILLMRNPIQQWLSGYQQKIKNDNDAFIIIYLLLMGLVKENKYIICVRNYYGIPQLNSNDMSELMNFYRQQKLSDEILYEIFLHIYIFTMIESYNQVDLVIDIDKLSKSKLYNKYIGLLQRSLTGVNLDFSDASVNYTDHMSFNIDFNQCNINVIEFFSKWLSRNRREIHATNKEIKNIIKIINYCIT
ncbi:hypothetical protein [Paenibacillus arenilitoris]|uniref:Sulfotransferase family protein n=1 Tax=Paenibacillus arenilitoris TaxID=2772299 RepID=A0A927H5W3_9BACL|nr:hypothetical protein [Paenibacillus arenilitoris]MBD2867964.1 hypothetical protein [Paenibacillus arenilitoris]